MGRVAARALSVAAALAFVLGYDPTLASADEHPQARLEYARGAGAAECPDETELKSIVAARLGYDPFSPDAARVVAVGVVRQGSGLVAHLEVRGAAARGSRDLQSSTRDCRELIDSLAVAIAIGIDPLSLSRVPSLPPLPAAEAKAAQQPEPPLPAAVPTVIDARPERPRASDPVRLRGSIGPLVSFGAAPSTNLGITAQVGVRWRAVSIGLEGRADFPVSQQAVDGGRVSASLLAATVVPCAHYGVLLGCLLGTFGALRAEGESVTTPLRETKLYAAIGGRVGVEIPVGSIFAIGVHGDLFAPLTQITLRLNDRDVWTTPVVAGGLGAALAVTF